jgi:nucleotide-binding universal stress UspA family protein
LGLQLVSQLTNQTEHGLITLFKILPASMQDSVEQQEQHLRFLAHQSLLDYQHDFTIDVKVSVSNEVVGPILDLAKAGRYDLLVLGASERSHVGRFLFGSIPHQIAAQSPCPVLIIRRAAPA